MDNLPEVPPEKFGKLSSVVHKIFSKAGNIRPGMRGCCFSFPSCVLIADFLPVERFWLSARLVSLCIRRYCLVLLLVPAACDAHRKDNGLCCWTVWSECGVPSGRRAADATRRSDESQQGLCVHRVFSAPGALWSCFPRLHAVLQHACLCAQQSAWGKPAQTRHSISYWWFTPSGGVLQEALAAQQLLNNYVLDKRHTFVVTMFDDFEKYTRVPLEYEAPEPKPFVATVCTPGSLVVDWCRQLNNGTAGKTAWFVYDCRRGTLCPVCWQSCVCGRWQVRCAMCGETR